MTDTQQIQRRRALNTARAILLIAKANGGSGLDGVWEYLRDCLDTEGAN